MGSMLIHIGITTPPPLNASELNAISDTLENLDSKEFFENFKPGDVLITSRTDLDDTWALANGESAIQYDDIYEQQKDVWNPLVKTSNTHIGFGNTNIISTKNKFLALDYRSGVGVRLMSRDKGSSAGTTITTIYEVDSNSDQSNTSFEQTISRYLEYNGTYYYLVCGTYKKVGGQYTDYKLYVAYTNNIEDINSWNVEVFNLNNQSPISGWSCVIQEINNEIVIFANGSPDDTHKGTIFHGTDINNMQQEEIIIDKNNFFYLPGIGFYDGKYYMVYETNNTFYIESSSTLSGFSMNGSLLGSFTSFGNAFSWTYGCQVSNNTIIFLSESISYLYYGIYVDMEDNRVGVFSTDQQDNNNGVVTMFETDQYVGSSRRPYGSIGNDRYGLLLIKKGKDAYSVVINDKGQDLFNKSPICWSARYYDALVGAGDYYSEPALPELSVNNAYAYVKISSS